MINYLKSDLGYFYKIIENNKKIRISKEEYYNNEEKQITNDDIIYKDDLVCILKPNIKKGMII
jgi:hypothetical protein